MGELMVIVVCSKTAWVRIPGQLKVSLHRYEFAVDKQ